MRGAGKFNGSVRVEQGGDAQQAPWRVADDNPGARMTAGKPDQLTGACQVDEVQAGQVQADLAGAAGGERGQRGGQGSPTGQVSFAGEHEAGAVL
jgi:hypothetical protein